MLQGVRRVFSVQELREKILYTVLLLIVVRIGSFIPVPGINGEIALNYFKFITKGGQNLFQLMDVFSGGAFAQMTVIALGIMPYITASIVIQVLLVILPGLQREIRENRESGKRKIGRWTRLLATGMSVFHSVLLARYALQMNLSRPGIVMFELYNIQIGGVPWLFYLVVIFTMTTGTLFLIWIGERISEKGIGNGISLIIAVGILSQIPSAVGFLIKQLNLQGRLPGQMSLSSLILLAAIFIPVIMATVLIIQGQRKVPLQYARRTLSGRASAGSAYIPLKVNHAGVLPVIFASTLLMFPATIAQLIGGTADGKLAALTRILSPGSTVYLLSFVALIICFTYVWTATQFRPEQIASEMKKNGAFIPGIRQGLPTRRYLEDTMNRITFIGALFLALIAVLPTLVTKILNVDMTVSHFFGGTSLLILVGVVLDTVQQIDSQLIMKKYDGLMDRSRKAG